MKVAAHARRARWRWIAGVILFSLTVAFGVQYNRSSRLEAAELRAWADMGRSMESLSARIPPTAPSSGLLKLEALTQPMGFSVLNKSYRETEKPEYSPRTLNLSFELRRYLGDALKEDRFVSPPNEVRVFLDEFPETLDEVETLLLGGDPIFWERELARLDGGPIPPIGNVYLLHGILLARALERSRFGGQEDPARPLDAAAKLVDAILESPDSLGYVLGLVRMHLAAVRRIGNNGSSASRAWVAALDLHEDLANAYQLELWREWQAGVRRFPGGEAMSKEWPSWSWPLVLELDLHRMPCIVARSKEIRVRLSRWPAASDVSIRDISGGRCSYNGRHSFFWPIASRAILDAELTLRVLDLKAGSTVLAPEPSRVSPRLQWEYESFPGGIAVSLGGDPTPLTNGDKWTYRVSF